MNLKSRLVGIVAGTAITLSLVSGAYAQQQASSTVTLATKAGGACTVAAVNGTFDFGTWQWDGSRYVAPSGNSVASVKVDVKQDLSPQNVNCRVTVTPGTLNLNGNSNGGNSVIQSGSLQTKVNGQGGGQAVISTPAGEGAKNQPVEISMNNIESNLAPGTYTGNVTISVAQGS